LTTKILREISQATHNNPIEQEPIDDANDEEYQSLNNFNADDDSDDSAEKDEKVNENNHCFFSQQNLYRLKI
jgi:hypothetical protein